MQYKHAIRERAEQHNLRRFLTLTLDPAKVEGDALTYLRECWRRFREHLRRRYGEAPKYICVLEFQKNGNPHLHILIDRFIEQAWIRQSWRRIGGGHQVDIRLVDLHRVSRYLSKYLTKEMLIDAPLRARRVTTSRGIKLLEKPKREYLWDVLRCPLDILFRRWQAAAIDVEVDEENRIESFCVIAT